MKKLIFLTLFIMGISQAKSLEQKPLVIASQGSFFVGGSVLKNDEGKSFHGDHAYVYYQKPMNAKKLPIVLLHGIHQATKTWESTPDGREGYANIFLRRGFSIYNFTTPRRGNASRSLDEALIKPVFDEESWFVKWRIGIYPNYFKGVQFSKDKESLNQFLRQITPNIGKIDFELNTNILANFFDELKGGIMMAHSQGVMHTWKLLPKTKNVKAVIALEGGGYFSFVKRPQTEASEGVEYIMVDEKTFKSFTKMPILLIYGDNIPTTKSNVPELDIWRIRLDLAKKWANAVNEAGGDVSLIHLPELKIYGNTHFLMSDLNNVEIADLISEWLKEKGLDK
ncbi:alpha/beta hydrolase [Campylobacter sp. MIT 99-7217]|uniref:alpha/beta hydrolase n=1 Tax=Campylobacter sp. MIT 99-7217 TaxID=535091 RepID=UPI001158F6E1|nr:alpha/beta fold hydrolase [Campylobacter sp. MIT 99-7217]TQR33128.1 alpha/beta hydrolase [Campylobacter sp. MIT 99-7217]